MSERRRFTFGLVLATVIPLALAALLGRGDHAGATEVLGALIVVAYAGHLAVTGWLWTVPDMRQVVYARPLRLVVVPIVLVLVAATAALVVHGHVLAWLLLAFFVWQFVHFQRQNLGLVTLIGTKWESEPLTRAERRLVSVSGWCSIGALVSRPTLLGLAKLTLPAVVSHSVIDIAGAGFTTCAIASAIATMRSRRPGPVSVAYVGAVMFMAPVFVFRTAEAAVTGMVIAHGLQYLWVVGWRSHEAHRPMVHKARWTVLRVAMVAVVGGAVLEAMSELHTASGGGLRMLYGTYLGIVMAHFAIDAVVWHRPTPQARTTARPMPLLPSAAHGRL